MPAAAVIPAPIAYTKVVAIKKLVVGSRVRARGLAIGWSLRSVNNFSLLTARPTLPGHGRCPSLWRRS